MALWVQGWGPPPRCHRLLLSVLLPPRGTSQALPRLGGDTRGQTGTDRVRHRTPCHAGGVPTSPCPAGAWGWGAELRKRGGHNSVREGRWGGEGEVWELQPRRWGEDPMGSPRELRGGSLGVRGWGGSGGAAPPCTPSASLSLPPVHSLCPPRGDGDGGGPLLLRQRPGGAQGVGITLGVVVPWLEVSGASGGFVQGGQTTRGGLRGARGATEPRRDPLRLDADGVVLRGAAGGRVLGGDNPGAGPGVRREGEAGCPHAASLADTQGVGRVSPPPQPKQG